LVSKKNNIRILAAVLVILTIAMLPLATMPDKPLLNEELKAAEISNYSVPSSTSLIYDIVIQDVEIMHDVMIYGSARVLVTNTTIVGDLIIGGNTKISLNNVHVDGYIDVWDNVSATFNNVTAFELSCTENTMINITNMELQGSLLSTSARFHAEKVSAETVSIWAMSNATTYIVLRNIWASSVSFEVTYGEGDEISEGRAIDKVVLDNVANISDIFGLRARILEVRGTNLSSGSFEILENGVFQDVIFDKLYMVGFGTVLLDNVTIGNALEIGYEYPLPYSDLTVQIMDSNISSLIINDFANITVKSSHIDYLEDAWFYRELDVIVNGATISPAPSNNYYVSLDSATTYNIRNVTGIVLESGSLEIRNVNGSATGLYKYGAIDSTIVIKNSSNIGVALRASYLLINNTSLIDSMVSGLRGRLTILPLAEDSFANPDIQVFGSNLTGTTLAAYNMSMIVSNSIGYQVGGLFANILLNDTTFDSVYIYACLADVAVLNSHYLSIYNSSITITASNITMLGAHYSSGRIFDSLIDELYVEQNEGLEIISTNITNLRTTYARAVKEVIIHSGELVSGIDSLDIPGTTFSDSSVFSVAFEGEFLIGNTIAYLDNVDMSNGWLHVISSTVTVNNTVLWGYLTNSWILENSRLTIVNSDINDIAMNLHDSEVEITGSIIDSITAYDSSLTINSTQILSSITIYSSDLEMRNSDVYSASWFWGEPYLVGYLTAYNSTILIEKCGTAFDGSGGIITLRNSSIAWIYNSSIDKITVDTLARAQINDSQVVNNIQYNRYVSSDVNITENTIDGVLEIPVEYSDNVLVGGVISNAIELYNSSRLVIVNTSMSSLGIYSLYLYSGDLEIYDSSIGSVVAYYTSALTGDSTTIESLDLYGAAYANLDKSNIASFASYGSSCFAEIRGSQIKWMWIESTESYIYTSQIMDMTTSGSSDLVVQDSKVEYMTVNEYSSLLLIDTNITELFLGMDISASIQNCLIDTLNIYYLHHSTVAQTDFGTITISATEINSTETLAYTGDELYMDSGLLSGEYTYLFSLEDAIVHEVNTSLAFLGESIGEIRDSSVYSVFINSTGDQIAPSITPLSYPTEIINGTTGNYLESVVEDPHLSEITVFRNETLIYENTTPAERQIVNISLDNLEIGTHIISIKATDSLENIASISLTVEVVPQQPPPGSQNPPPRPPITISTVIAIVIGIVGAGIVILIALKHARKK